MADFTWKQGETARVATDTLEVGGEPVDLTGATVAFTIRSLTSPQPLTLTGLTTILDPLGGVVEYAPSAADLSVPGQYMATWNGTLADGSTFIHPTRGYLWVSIEENLTTAGGQQLVSLPDVKDYLNVPGREHDAKLIRFIHSVRPLVEAVTGPIIPAVFEEWHDGGQYFIQVRRRPQTGYGTTPILDLVGVDEYRGPTRYSLAIVADPSAGTTYSVQMDRLGKIVRRSAGGGVIAFPSMPNSVHVFYRAGQQTVPPNVYEGTLELIRVNYRTTQPTGRGMSSMADFEDLQQPPMGFFMPRRVRELLAPTRRAPVIA